MGPVHPQIVNGAGWTPNFQWGRLTPKLPMGPVHPQTPSFCCANTRRRFQPPCTAALSPLLQKPAASDVYANTAAFTGWRSAVLLLWLISVIRTGGASRGCGEEVIVWGWETVIWELQYRETERERETLWHLPCPAVKLHCWVNRAAAARCKNRASASINLLAKAFAIPTTGFSRNKGNNEKG